MTTATGRATLAERLAQAALDPLPAALSPAATAKARTCLLDFLSCAFEARALPWSRQAVALARGSAGTAAVVGIAGGFAPAEAAFANAVLGHGLVREDMHAASITHLGVVLWPTLFALSQGRAVSGRDLLEAAIVGYEVGGRIGRALMTSDLARLFRPTGLIGPLAATLAGSRLLGLGAPVAVNALALAANTSAGLNQWAHSGGSEMYFHPGFVARNAVTCLALAQAGAVASPDVLEGESGLFAAFARRPLEPARAAAIALFPDGAAEILAVFNKPVPACNFAQTPCQAALLAARSLAARGLQSRDVAGIAIEVSDAARRYPGCDATGPFAWPLQAKMSIPFGVAATIASGRIAEDNYGRLADAEIVRLIDATRLVDTPALTARFPAEQGARVTLALADGTTIAHALDDVVAATPELVRERFAQAGTDAIGAARLQRLAAFVDALGQQADAGRINDCFAAAAPAGSPA